MSTEIEAEISALTNSFPVEIWSEILGHVKDARSYQNVAGASPCFRNLMMKQRVRTLFPEVAYLVFDHERRGGETTSQRILRLGGVCSDWKAGVLKVMQMGSQDSFDCFPLNAQDPRLSLEKTLFPNFKSAEDYKTFNPGMTHQLFDSSHPASNWSPLLQQSACFHFKSYKDSQKLNTLCSESVCFLKKYGKFIRYAFFTCAFSDSEQLGLFIKTLPGMLKNMKKLRALEISNESCAPPPPDLAKRLLEQDTEKFPRLPALKYLFLPQVPLPVIKEIAIQNPHVEKVDIRSGYSTEAAAEIQLYFEKFRRLTGLSLGLRTPTILNAFHNTNVDSKIVDLKLDMSTLWSESWTSILQIISLKFPHLVNFFVIFPPLLRYCLEDKLVLQSLKALTLVLSTPVPLDFLLPMSNTLQYVTVTVTTGDAEGAHRKNPEGPLRKSVIDLYKHWNAPELSNMWKKFPELKTIKTNNPAGEDQRWFRATRSDSEKAEGSE